MIKLVRSVGGVACKTCQLDELSEFLDPKEVVKQGWVKKRGEFIRNWRARYFVLRADGVLLGVSKKGQTSQVVNHFHVKSCQIETMDKPMPHTILIKFTRDTPNLVERMFCVDTEEEKDSWIDAFKSLETVEFASEPLSPEPIPDELDVAVRRPESKLSFADLEFKSILGFGTYGKVYLCRDKKTSSYYAVKKLRKEMVIKNAQVRGTQTENRILKTTSHPFLIGMRQSFQTTDNLFFVLEFANGGDLYFHLLKHRYLSEECTKFYAAELVMALGYLHACGVVYRDLKLENILLNKDGHIKIADFGLCKILDPEDSTSTFCGTPEYIAPEVIFCEGGYSFAVDWWSLGVLMYEIMYGRLPFFNPDKILQYQLILEAEPTFPGKISVAGENFLRGLLEKNPSKRLGGGLLDCQEIMEHEFFAGMDWDKLYNLEIEPPFVPELDSNSDLRYFDRELTRQSVESNSIRDSSSSGGYYCVEEDERFDDFDFIDEY